MSLVQSAVMAESQRLDALLDQVVEWHGLEAFGTLAGVTATAEVAQAESTPRAGRKRARAPSSPQQQENKSSMRQWQEEATKLWQKRAEMIAAASAGSDKRMASWQKRKVELQALRAEVQQLQEQLRTLQDRQTDESRHRRVRQRQYIEIAWKLAAEREQAQMEAAVAENARLKTLVDRHLELSRVLQPTLFQDGSTDLPRQARLQTAVERATLFASMELKLTARLPNIKAVARRAALAASAPADSHSMHVIDTTSSHPLGSLQQCRTFPFGVDAVMDAKWGCAQRGFPDVAARTHSAEMLSEDALGIDILVDLPPEHPVSGRVSLHLRGVLKRWTTSVGSIVQFAGMSEWHTDSSAATWVTEEFSWSVIRALGSARSSHMQRTTESTFVSLGASPEAAPSVDSSLTASREAMETVVLPCIQHVTDRVDQATENALLDVARRG